MKIYFYLRYHTRFGQTLFVSGNCPELGNGHPEDALPMEYLNNELWTASIEIDPVACPEIHYSYLLHLEDGSVVADGEKDRKLDLKTFSADDLHLTDTWNYSGEYLNVFYSSPFQEVLLPNPPGTRSKTTPAKTDTHIFRVKAPLLKKDEVLCMTGSSPLLGEWSTDTPKILRKEGNWWTTSFNLSDIGFPIAYKYGIYNQKSKQFLQFESGNNRVLYDPAVKSRLHIIHDGFAWLSNTTWRGTGVSVPVFSLRTGNGLGVGEFSDLRLLADWAAKAGMKMIQILPVNDTTATHTWTDSYPYAAISAFALHPIYINLEKVAGKEHAAISKTWKKNKKQLNELPSVDYEQVMTCKLPALRELFQADNGALFETAAYKAFYSQNEHWLEPYAAFCYLRDKYLTADFSKWKTGSTYDAATIKKLTAPSAKHHDDIAIHFFIQYHLHLQLKEAVDYARNLGIVIKGDIPIGIYRHSADAWVDPSLYNMDKQAGAPPDSFAIKGQNWGFPTYNWSAMQQDGFAWWKKRFEQMSLYFDAFRIDHILGFFRIWSIPMHAVEGIMGHFVPAIPVHADEFERMGIAFNHDRFCKPHINDANIWELFDGDAEHIKQQFLEPAENGLYKLKPEFSTQRKVEAWFNNLEQNDHNNKIRHGLYDLISNVILFDDELQKGTGFHFRFGVAETSSYKQLDEFTRRVLDLLYENYFFRRQDDFWKQEAMHKLPDLKAATNMLIFGEDLGLVPACVPDVMKELAILSLEIQRMPKAAGMNFAHPARAPYLSVVTPGTHDMSTIRGWWEENRPLTQEFYNQIMGQWGEAPYFCEAWINKAILLQHLYSPAMWCVLQIQDILGIDERLRRDNPHDERINIPANPRHYWRYRMHLPLEELLRQKTFTEEMNTYIRQSGRS